MIQILMTPQFQQYFTVDNKNKFMAREKTEIIFDEDSNNFIYKKSKEPYKGHRISSIISKTTSFGYSSSIEVKDKTLELLLKENEEIDADAYEMVSFNILSCWQEFYVIHISPDQEVYRASVGVIFYSNKDEEK